MKTALALLLFIASPAVLAHNCPKLMKDVDAQLSSAKNISQENKDKAKQLRAQGESLHKEGKHDESMKALEQAKKLLSS